MDQGIKLRSNILVEDFTKFENDFGQKCGLEQLLPAEQTAQAQVNAFRDGYNDEIMVNVEGDGDLIPPMGVTNEEFSQEYMPYSNNGDVLRKRCHLVSEKKRRIAMRDTFTYLSDLITECQPSKQSKAEILSSASRYLVDLDKQNREIENSMLALKAEMARMHQT